MQTKQDRRSRTKFPFESENQPRQPSKSRKSEKVRSSITHFHLYFQVRDRPEVTQSGVHFLSNSFSWSRQYLAASAAPLNGRRHLARRQSITCCPDTRTYSALKVFDTGRRRCHGSRGAGNAVRSICCRGDCVRQSRRTQLCSPLGQPCGVVQWFSGQEVRRENRCWFCYLAVIRSSYMRHLTGDRSCALVWWTTTKVVLSKRTRIVDPLLSALP